MNDLIAFLRARLDEDQRSAEAARDEIIAAQERRDTEEIDLVDAGDFPLWFQHANRHRPTFVLADVDAKKRIVERHKECGTGFGYCDEAGGAIEADENNEQRGCPDLFALALPYADHPDYREEWRPCDR